MTGRTPLWPLVLSLFSNEQPLLDGNILLLMMHLTFTIIAITINPWLKDFGDLLFLKAVGALTALGNYLEYPQGLNFNDKNDGDIKHGIPKHDESVEKGSVQDSPDAPEAPSDTSDRTSVLCLACHEQIKAQRPSSSKISTARGAPAAPEDLTKTANPGNNPASLANAALTSLADDLEFDVAHLTRAEAYDMLVELQSLRSTVGSRVSLFTMQSDAPVETFAPDASYGESWFDSVEQGKETGQEKEIKIHNSHGHNSGIPEQLKGLEMQSEDEDGSGIKSTTSGSHHSRHSNAACSECDPYSISTQVRGVVPSALNVINFVKDALHDKLQNLSSSEIDTLLGRLRNRRRKIIRLGASAIRSSLHPDWGTSRTEYDEYVALENAQLNAYVGLVDGIMLAILERCNSSQSLLTENSNYTWSVYDSDCDELTRDDMDRLGYQS